MPVFREPAKTSGPAGPLFPLDTGQILPFKKHGLRTVVYFGLYGVMETLGVSEPVVVGRAVLTGLET